ncbi:hypothetical protein [Streptomyces sp. Ac-502]|uniref:hypothetical protein n=1 Tax=Streptomyces sp. Ac-502 TaxID=3342801 RepID=UPI003862B1A0
MQDKRPLSPAMITMLVAALADPEERHLLRGLTGTAVALMVRGLATNPRHEDHPHLTAEGIRQARLLAGRSPAARPEPSDTVSPKALARMLLTDSGYTVHVTHSGTRHTKTVTNEQAVKALTYLLATVTPTVPPLSIPATTYTAELDGAVVLHYGLNSSSDFRPLVPRAQPSAGDDQAVPQL